jgi:hypothetical protein
MRKAEREWQGLGGREPPNPKAPSGKKADNGKKQMRFRHEGLFTADFKKPPVAGMIKGTLVWETAMIGTGT